MDGGGLGGTVVVGGGGAVAAVRFQPKFLGYAESAVVVTFAVANTQVGGRVLDIPFVGADLVLLLVVTHIGLSWFAIHTTQYALPRGRPAGP